MRKSWMLSALLLSGCGGVTPEIYQLLIDIFTLPDSCYTNMMQPTSGLTTAPPELMQVQVWDGPEGTAFMQVEQGGGTIDMGAAPSVPVNGIFTGKRGDKGLVFTSDYVSRTTAANTTFVDTTHAELAFERGGGTFKGTGALSSSRTCSGMNCGGMTQPSCSVSGINFRGSRIAVDFERAP
ncbi:MAG: hypothetical protein JNM17_05835 [Archangium sp.]|nr:hypothetical protein [Archangium sp.]